MSEHGTQFQDFIEQSLRSEVAPSTFASHPELEDFMRLISGDTPPDAREEVAAHLALCVPCRKRWHKLAEAVKRQEQALLASARYPTLSALAEKSSQRPWLSQVGDYIAQRMRSFVPAWSLAGALGTAVVAAVVCLCVLLPPAAREWGRQARHTDLNGETVTKDIPVPDIVPQPASWDTPEALVKGVNAMAQYPLSRAIAEAIGQLRAEGVPLGLEGVAFTHDQVRLYTVHEGDSWGSIAGTSLGSEALWPLIVLLNAAQYPDGQLPHAGASIRVPAR
jgi:nucleoid-associated protein YgaU